MRKLDVALTLAFLGSAAMSAWLWSELRAERAHSAELSARIDTQASAPIAPVESIAAPPAPTPAPASVQTVMAVESATAQSSRIVQVTPNDWEAQQRRMMQDPRYREAWRAQQRLAYARRRDNVIRLLGFTPEQADAIVDLEIDQQLRMYDRQLSNPQTPEDTQRFMAREEQDKRDDEARLLEMLGPEKSARFQQYMETRMSRMQVDQLRTQLAGADALREDQAEPLITALHGEYARMQEDVRAYREQLSPQDATPDSRQKFNERELEFQKATYERMLSAAGPILSSTQLEKLDAMLKRDLERYEAQERMQRLEAKLTSSKTTNAD